MSKNMKFQHLYLKSLSSEIDKHWKSSKTNIIKNNTPTCLIKTSKRIKQYYLLYIQEKENNYKKINFY